MEKKTLNLTSTFEMWSAERPLAPSTRRAYKQEIERFRKWQDNNPWERLAGEHMRDYMDMLTSTSPEKLEILGITRPLSNGSLLQAKRILGAFLLWLAAKGDCELSAALMVKAWRPVSHLETTTNAVSTSTLYQSYAEMEPPQNIRLHALRDQCIQHIGFWSGASRHELAQLKTTDLKVSRGLLRIRLKRRDEAMTWTSLPGICLSWWNAYTSRMKRAADNNAEFAFRSVRDPTNGLTPASIAHAIAQLHPVEGNEEIHATLRGMRREFTVLAYQNGWRAGTLAFHLRRMLAPSDTDRVRRAGSKQLEILASAVVT